MDLFKEIIPSIMSTKKDFSNEESFESSYVPFVVNKAISHHLDGVLYANEMNQRPFLDKKLQYQYFLNTIRAYKRPFQQWLKKEKSETLDMIKEYYGYSHAKAKEAMKLLSEADLLEIAQRTNKGGISNVNDGRHDRSEVEAKR